MSELGYRERCLAQKINTCNICGTGDELVVHHINGDCDDDRLENLIPVCRSCHPKIHLTEDPEGGIRRLQEKLPESATRPFGPVGEVRQFHAEVDDELFQRLRIAKGELDAETNRELLEKLLGDYDNGD